MQVIAAQCRLFRSTGITMVDAVDNPSGILSPYIDIEPVRVNTTANAVELSIDYPFMPADDTHAPIWDVDYCKLGINGDYYYYFVIPSSTTRISARTVKMFLRLDSIATAIELGIEVSGRLARIHPNEEEDTWFGSETDEPVGNLFPQKTTFQDLDLNPDNNWTQLIVSSADLKYADTVSKTFYDSTSGHINAIPSHMTKPPEVNTVVQIRSGTGLYPYKLGSMAVYNYEVIRDNREANSWDYDQGLTSLMSTGNTNMLSDSYLVPTDYIKEPLPPADNPLYATLTSKQVSTEESAWDGETADIRQKIRKQIFTPIIPWYKFQTDRGTVTTDFNPDTSSALLNARLDAYMRGGCLKAFYQNVTHTIVSWANGQSMTTSAANLRTSGCDSQVAPVREFPTGNVSPSGNPLGNICPMENRVAITTICNPGPKGCLYMKYAQLWNMIPASFGGLIYQNDPNFVSGISATLEQSISNSGWSSYAIGVHGSPGYLVASMDSYFNKTSNALGLGQTQLGQTANQQSNMKAQLQKDYGSFDTGVASGLGAAAASVLPGGSTGLFDSGGNYIPAGIAPALSRLTSGTPVGEAITAGWTNDNEQEIEARLMAYTEAQYALNDMKYTANASLAAAQSYSLVGHNSDLTTSLLLSMCVQLRCSFDDPRDVMEHCRYYLMFGYTDGRTVQRKELRALVNGRRRFFCYVQFDYANVRINNPVKPGVHQNIKEDISMRLMNGIRLWHISAGGGDQGVESPDASHYYANNGFPGTTWAF